MAIDPPPASCPSIPQEVTAQDLTHSWPSVNVSFLPLSVKWKSSSALMLPPRGQNETRPLPLLDDFLPLIISLALPSTQISAFLRLTWRVRRGLSARTGPGVLPQAAHTPPSCNDSRGHTRRVILGLAPSWQPPSRNRCQAAKATCCWGRARARLPSMRRGEGKPRWRQHLGVDSSFARQSRPVKRLLPGHPRVQPWPSKTLFLTLGPSLDEYVCLSWLASVFKTTLDGQMGWDSSLEPKHRGRSEPTAKSQS